MRQGQQLWWEMLFAGEVKETTPVLGLEEAEGQQELEEALEPLVEKLREAVRGCRAVRAQSIAISVFFGRRYLR